MRALSIPVLLFACALPAAAADLARIEGVLSLEDAVKLALQYNRSLRIAVEEEEIARGKIQEAWAEALPEVRLDANYERKDRELAFEIPDGPRVTIGYLDNYRADLVVTQPVFQGGRAAAALRAARIYRSWSEESVRKAAEAAVYDTTRAYYAALLAGAQAEVADSNARLSERLLADVETKKKFGVASDFNVLRAQVEASNAKATLVAFRNRLRTSMSDLYRTLGVSQDSDVTLVREIAFEELSLDEEAALAEARATRPDLRAAALEIGLRREAVNVAKSDYFPSIDLYFVQTWARPDPVITTVDAWGDAWAAGVNVSFMLFDGLRRKGRLIQERAVLRQAELAREDLEERTRADVRRALLSVADAAEAVRVQEKTIEQAREGLRIAEVGYREGSLDQVAVLEARAALTQSQYLYYESLHAHAVARLDLALAQGRLVPEPPAGS